MSSARAAGGRASRRGSERGLHLLEGHSGVLCAPRTARWIPSGRLSEFIERKLLFEVVLEALW